LNRQANALAKCTAEYRVGDEVVFTITPQEAWRRHSEFFTAAMEVEGASVDVRITASCAGYEGMPVTDTEGWMRVEVSGVSVVMDGVGGDVGKKSVQVQGVERAVKRYAALVWE
jgi:hypothetical protein